MTISSAFTAKRGAAELPAVLDTGAENLDPFVLPLLPDREFRRQRVGIVERAQWDGDQSVEPVFNLVMYGRAALRAEMMRDAVSAVGEVHPGLR